MRLAAGLAAALALAAAAPAAAAPPAAGVLVPGRTLGGVALGATGAEVERLWGRAYGTCRGCPRLTWYFNYFAYRPQGAGVELRQGRVAAVFTLYQPAGWRTRGGIELGDPATRVTDAYRRLERHGCGGYTAFALRGTDVTTVFYVLDDRLWAFGLSRTGLPLCR